VEEYPEFDGSQVCAQTDPDLWFPTSEKQTGRIAKNLCRSCIWLTPCLKYALRHEVVGVWGATTERERAQMRKQLDITAIPLYSSSLFTTSLRGKVAVSGYNDGPDEVGNG
jgi:hypothetical protein